MFYCQMFLHVQIKAEGLPGDLTDGRLVKVDRRWEVWLGRVNRKRGHVLLISCPALLNLRKENKERNKQNKNLFLL